MQKDISAEAKVRAMCGRCVIFTFDEVLEVIREIEVGTPFDFEPDWPRAGSRHIPSPLRR